MTGAAIFRAVAAKSIRTASKISDVFVRLVADDVKTPAARQMFARMCPRSGAGLRRWPTAPATICLTLASERQVHDQYRDRAK
jgi:hypothetical protein